MGQNADLLINLDRLRSEPDGRRVVPVELLVEGAEVVGTKVSNSPVIGSLLVSATNNGAIVHGQLHYHWEASCRRCLKDLRNEAVADVAEIFEAGAPDDSDAIGFSGDEIDLTGLITEAVVLGLPLAPLCGPDCLGPDPARYPTGTVDDTSPSKDPRWDGLSELKFD